MHGNATTLRSQSIVFQCCARASATLDPGLMDQQAKVHAVSRPTPPRWRSIRFRLALRTYNAPPWGVRVVPDRLTKSRKIPTRKILPFLFVARRTPLRNSLGQKRRAGSPQGRPLHVYPPTFIRDFFFPCPTTNSQSVLPTVRTWTTVVLPNTMIWNRTHVVRATLYSPV